MTKLLSLAAVIGISFFYVAAVQAMPLAPLEQAQASLTIPVAGGCGPGFHPGPYGGCRRNGYCQCDHGSGLCSQVWRFVLLAT